MILNVTCLLIAATYNPSTIPAGYEPKFVDRTLHDSKRNRDVPIRVYLPKSTSPQPLVIFSHGLGGSRENNGYLGRHLASRGYVVLFVQHPGSDESVWKDTPMRDRMQAMQTAANGQNLELRVDDVHFVLDQMTTLNKSDSQFKGRIDLNHVGMSGHSFGAMTSQAVGGQNYPMIGQKWTDSRIDAAVMYSPSSPGPDAANSRAFSKVTIPWLLMTGTEDSSPIGGQTPESRTKVYPALPNGNKFEVVLFGAEHSAFSERGLPGDSRTRNPNHHKVILALTTAFWDAYLRNDPAAKSWLTGPSPRSIMEPKDTWKKK